MNLNELFSYNIVIKIVKFFYEKIFGRYRFILDSLDYLCCTLIRLGGMRKKWQAQHSYCQH